MLSLLPVPVVTIGLLLCSNLFMTFAWYGHLRFPKVTLFHIIIISWLIAFFEYCFQVPANRIGFGYFSAAELKTIQEIISLSIFMIFSVTYLGEPLKWNYILGFALIMLAAFVIFHEW
ncbi:MAG: DMT family protein [Sutterella sp.]|nr:DMT family protein [Sutterella sp.]